MEKSAAKRPRLEHNYCQDLEEIIQEQRGVIKNQKARIDQLEELLKELLINSESSATEIKIKNVLVPAPELPNEIWSEIISYLSTFDILRNVAQVSKRFHKLSENPHVIRRIEVDPDHSWPEDKREKYCDDFLAVLKRSVKLRNFSFCFSWDINNDTSGEKFLAALPSMNHQFLQEFCLKGDGKEDFWKAAAFLDPLNENILNYLEKCSDLKVLKFEFKPELSDDNDCITTMYPSLYEMEEAIKSLKVKKLQEFHLIGVHQKCESVDMFEYSDTNITSFKLFLDMIAENMPKLQRLCLTCQDEVEDTYEWNEMCQEFASRKNIKLEISSVVKQVGEWSCVEFTRRKNVPIKETKVFCPN